MQPKSDSFENEFWKPYPRKVGKPAALRAYLRVTLPNPTDIPRIKASIERHKLTDQWQNPKYIPHPATFLNQRRFDDEPIVDDVVVASQREWEKLMEYIRRHGRYGTVSLPLTEKGRRALLGIGGFYDLCNSTEFKCKQLGKKFVKIYQVI